MDATIDWHRNQELLIEASRTTVTRFLKAHSNKKLRAIGFVFELGNISPQFDLCADIASPKDVDRAGLNSDVRWNSGDYKFPAGLVAIDELGEAWISETERLHDLASKDRLFKGVYSGLMRISCETLVQLAVERIFGDWNKVDFNVSEVNDDIKLVIRRDQRIREKLKSMT